MQQAGSLSYALRLLASGQSVGEVWREAGFRSRKELAEKVFDLASSITRMPCGCRFLSTGKTDKRYCFGLGMDKLGVMGKYPDAVSSLEVLDRDEAKKIAREYDEEGLMHSVWTGITPYVMGICNCDHDCKAYRGYIEHDGPADFFRGEEVGRSTGNSATDASPAWLSASSGP